MHDQEVTYLLKWAEGCLRAVPARGPGAVPLQVSCLRLGCFVVVWHPAGGEVTCLLKWTAGDVKDLSQRVDLVLRPYK